MNLSEPPGGDFVKYYAFSKTKTPRKKWTTNLDITHLNLSETPGGDFVKYYAFSKTKTPRKKWTTNLDAW